MGSTSFFQKKAEAYALRKGIRTAASSGKPDWDLVDEGLWLAAQQAEAAAASGELPGVTHILQVAAEVSPSYPERFMYCHIPALDLEQQELVGILQTCITFIHNARQQGGCVLVHCMAGVSRSAAVVLGYWMWRDRVGLQAALTRLRSARPCCNPHQGFLLQLQLFEEGGFSWEGWEPWSLQRFLDARSHFLSTTPRVPGVRALRGVLDGSVDGIEGVAASPRLGRTSSDVPEYKHEWPQGGSRSQGGGGSNGGAHSSAASSRNSSAGGAVQEQVPTAVGVSTTAGASTRTSTADTPAVANSSPTQAQTPGVMLPKPPRKAAAGRGQQGGKQGLSSPSKPPLHPGSPGALGGYSGDAFTPPQAVVLPASVLAPVPPGTRPVLPHRMLHNRLSGPGRASTFYNGTAPGAAGDAPGAFQMAVVPRYPSAHQLSRPLFEPPDQQQQQPTVQAVQAHSYSVQTAVQGSTIPAAVHPAVQVPAPPLPLPGVVPVLHARSAQLQPSLSTSLDALVATGLGGSSGTPGTSSCTNNLPGMLRASWGAMSHEDVMSLAADLMAAAAGEQPPSLMAGNAGSAAELESRLEQGTNVLHPTPHHHTEVLEAEAGSELPPGQTGLPGQPVHLGRSGGPPSSSSSAAALSATALSATALSATALSATALSAAVLPPELGWNGRPPVRLRRAGSGLPIHGPPAQVAGPDIQPRPASAAAHPQAQPVSNAVQVQVPAQVHVLVPPGQVDITGAPPRQRGSQLPPQPPRKPAWPTEVLHNTEVFHLPPIAPPAPGAAGAAAGLKPTMMSQHKHHHHPHHKAHIAAGLQAKMQVGVCATAASSASARLGRSHINIPVLPTPASPRLPLISTVAGAGGSGGSGPGTPVHHADEGLQNHSQQPQQQLGPSYHMHGRKGQGQGLAAATAGMGASAVPAGGGQRWAATRSHPCDQSDLPAAGGVTCTNNMSDRDMVEYLLSMALMCTTATEEGQEVGTGTDLMPTPASTSAEQHALPPCQGTCPAVALVPDGGNVQDRRPGAPFSHQLARSPSRPSAQALLLRALSHSSHSAVRAAFNEQARLFSASYPSNEQDEPHALALQLLAAIQGEQLQATEHPHICHPPITSQPLDSKAVIGASLPQPCLQEQQSQHHQQGAQYPDFMRPDHMSPDRMSPDLQSLMLRDRRFWEGLISSVGGTDLLEALQGPLQAAGQLLQQQHQHQQLIGSHPLQQPNSTCREIPVADAGAHGFQACPAVGGTLISGTASGPLGHVAVAEQGSLLHGGAESIAAPGVIVSGRKPPIAIPQVSTPPAVVTSRTARSETQPARSGRSQHDLRQSQGHHDQGHGYHQDLHNPHDPHHQQHHHNHQDDLHDPYHQHQHRDLQDQLHPNHHHHPHDHQHAASAPDSPVIFNRSRSATEPAQRGLHVAQVTRHSPAGSSHSPHPVTLTQAMVRAFEATFGPSQGQTHAVARHVRSMSGAPCTPTPGGTGSTMRGGGAGADHGGNILDTMGSWAGHTTGHTTLTSSTCSARQGSLTCPSPAASGTAGGGPGSTMGGRTPFVLDGTSSLPVQHGGASRYSFSRAARGAGMGNPGSSREPGRYGSDNGFQGGLELPGTESVTYDNDASHRSSDQPPNVTPLSGLSPAGTADPACLTGPQSSLSMHSSLFSDLGGSTNAPNGMGHPGSTIGGGVGAGSCIPSLVMSGGVARTPSALSTFSLASSRASGNTGCSLGRAAPVQQHQQQYSTAGGASAGHLQSHTLNRGNVTPFQQASSRLSRRFTDENGSVTPAAAPITLDHTSHALSGPLPDGEQDSAV